MKVQFFKDGRKTNTVEQFATDSDGHVLLDEKGRKVVEKEQIEFKTILLETPVYENTINFDKYGRGSVFHLLTDEEYQALTEGKSFAIPEHVRQGVKNVAQALVDLMEGE